MVKQSFLCGGGFVCNHRKHAIEGPDAVYWARGKTITATGVSKWRKGMRLRGMVEVEVELSSDS
jgi:hypothetical protein